jgi:thiol-disulfide isomerase/thioredoxin
MHILKPLSLLILVVALVLAACGAGESATPAAPQAAGPAVIAAESRLLDSSGGTGMPNVGEVAPNFEYTLSDGTRHQLSDLHGKKVLLNFWATWCEPCRAEMPDLQQVLANYGDSVVVLGVNKLETAAVIPPFAEELGVSFPLIVNTEGDIANRYGAKNIPSSFFINTDGTIGARRIGVMTYDFMKSQIDQLK